MGAATTASGTGRGAHAAPGQVRRGRRGRHDFADVHASNTYCALGPVISGGLASVEETTADLSALADCVIQAGLEACVHAG